MNNRSRSTLFLIEQLIVIAVFALCASACITILTDAYFTANNSKDISNALLAAESGAESFKATGGDPGRVAQIMGGSHVSLDGAPAAIVYYNSRWKVCGENDAVYQLSLKGGGAGDRSALQSGEISVKKLTGEVLVAFTVLARG